jgi:dolichyl-phosphate-mannose--protein O-mannosyl transferase
LPANKCYIPTIIKNLYNNESVCFMLNAMLLCYSLYSIYSIIRLQQYYQLYFVFFNSLVLCSYCFYKIHQY